MASLTDAQKVQRYNLERKIDTAKQELLFLAKTHADVNTQVAAAGYLNALNDIYISTYGESEYRRRIG